VAHIGMHFSAQITPLQISTPDIDESLRVLHDFVEFHRGVSNPEKLALTVSGKGTGSGEIKGKWFVN